MLALTSRPWHMQAASRKMQVMRATFNKLKDLASKWLAPTRPLALQAQPDITRALRPTNLRERLTSLSITQSQFADLCQVHPNTVSNWASGRTRMNHAAELVLQVLEADRRAAQYVADQRTKGRPRGKPFAQGNPYRFGDRRRKHYVAGAQIARAVAA
jgi:DNA-binding transcriptional regulator YiaG